MRLTSPAELAKISANPTSVGPIDFQQRAIQVWLVKCNNCLSMAVGKDGIESAFRFKNASRMTTIDRNVAYWKRR